MKPRLLELAACEGGATALRERFWSHVNVRDDVDVCWEWTASRRQNGYGQINIARYPFKAHRVAFVLAFGWEPPAVLHKCDNPPCVNPRHLFGGTQKENVADARAKGRLRNQIQAPVKSTVRALYEDGMAQRAIARQLGINRRSVGRILKEVPDVASPLA